MSLMDNWKITLILMILVISTIFQITISRYDFLLCYVVLTNHSILLTGGLKQMKYDDSTEEHLDWPWKLSECWQVSGSHPSVNSRMLSNYGTLIMDSLDMGPDLYAGWNTSYEYYDSTGTVVAANSGVVRHVTNCSLEITGYNYSTWYSHIKVSVKNYQRVRKGDKIGVIDVNQESSNCGCRMFGGQIDCSFYGPHLHFELRKSNGEPETLNGKVIGGYQIVTGRYAYDEYCYDHMDCNNATEHGKSCATKFIDLENNVTFCPSVMGSNTGESNKTVTKLRIAVKLSPSFLLYNHCSKPQFIYSI